MGFGQALSGLNAAAKQLDVIGNNIANANTVGYKAGSVTFADLYASSRIGLGVQVTGINQRFTTGNLELTGNQYDMAIDGDNGFFRLISQNGEIVYSRNGQFSKDVDHYIVNASGQRLTGYPVGMVGTTPEPLRVPVGNMSPRATSEISVDTNLDARAEAIDPALRPFDPNDPLSFTHASPITVYDSLGNAHQLVQYFIKRDAQAAGNDWEVRYTLNGKPVDVGTPEIPERPAIPPVEFSIPTDLLQAGEKIVKYEVSGRVGYAIVQTPSDPDAQPVVYHLVLGAITPDQDDPNGPSTITVSRGTVLTGAAAAAAIASTEEITNGTEYRAGVPAQPAIPATWGDAGVLSFDTNGRLVTNPPVLNLRIVDPTGGTGSAPAEDMLIAVDFTGSTQFGAAFRQNVAQNGYTSGEFVSINVSPDGTIAANFTNGQTEVIGIVALAGFNNVNGLKPIGQNAWAETPESGPPILGQPGSNGLANVMGQAVESSNVDLSAELVNMIIAQRAYQANAQTMKTQDQMMQTLISMR